MIFDDEYKRHLELSDKYKVEFFYYYANYNRAFEFGRTFI